MEGTGRLTCSTGGWIAVVSPSGKRLAWREGEPDPQWLSAIVKEGLEAWDSLPESEREAHVDATARDAVAFPQAPPKGLVLAAYVRALRRNSTGGYERISEKDLSADPEAYPNWGIDNTRAKMDVAWFTEDEWKSLVSGTLRPGDRIPMNKTVRRRLIRHHLVDLSPNNPVRSWDEEDIQKDNITLVVDSVSPLLRFHVEGIVRLKSGPEKDRFAHDGLIDLGDGKTLPARTKSYEAEVRGLIEYDANEETFTRFDVVAIGDYAGSQEEAVLLSRPGANPLGVAFTLADSWQRAVLWPSVIDDHEKGYFASQ